MKTILASLTGLPSDRAALKTAAAVAKTNGAHLDALHVYMGLRSLSEMTGTIADLGASAQAASSELMREESERRHRARAMFDEICLREGLPTVVSPSPGPSGASAAFVEVESLALGETARRARFYDLTVMAREQQLLEGRIPAVVMGSGRPLLLAAPNARDTIGSNIGIAWKPCAEAARAVAAATPFLARAAKVTILVVPERDASQSSLESGALSLQETLAWRGIQAHIVTTEAGGDAAQSLRESAYGQEMDLLVAGAYGHSRLRELVLGGVTEELLRACDIPLLMAH